MHFIVKKYWKEKFSQQRHIPNITKTPKKLSKKTKQKIVGGGLLYFFLSFSFRQQSSTITPLSEEEWDIFQTNFIIL